MDPYLEHPRLWPDVYNSLIAAIRDAVTPLVAPRYYVGLESRVFQIRADDVVLVGVPDIVLVPRPPYDMTRPTAPSEVAGVAVLDVELPMIDGVEETFLEIREVKTGLLVTILELLSPTNKMSHEGRDQYMSKRTRILGSRTNLVEIDLLRDGEPMEVIGASKVKADYRVIVSRGRDRPRAKLYAFGLRTPIPRFYLPLLPGEDEPPVELNAILHALYERARFDLRLDYEAPPVPPLADEDAAWARGLIGRG
jgi:hypothetical protein